jgi:hypothetical protein
VCGLQCCCKGLVMCDGYHSASEVLESTCRWAPATDRVM